MSGQEEQTNSPIRLWVRLVFGASLALNVLVLGLVGGAILRFGGPDGFRPPVRSIGTMLFRELPREDRRALRREAMAAYGDRPSQRGDEMAAVAAALRTAPFDAGALADLLARHNAQRADFTGALHDAWIKRVVGMTDKDRQAYADRLEQALAHSHDHDHGRDHRDRDD